MIVEAEQEITLTPVPHYDVIICTPGSSMNNSYTSSLLDTIQILNSMGISWKYQNEYTSIVATAREGTIADTMNFQVDTNKPGLGKYTYNKIFMIDSDISCTVDDFLKLSKADRIYAFINLLLKSKQLPRKKESDKSDNFLIVINTNQ
jgi:hypothetical protein